MLACSGFGSGNKARPSRELIKLATQLGSTRLKTSTYTDMDDEIYDKAFDTDARTALSSKFLGYILPEKTPRSHKKMRERMGKLKQYLLIEPPRTEELLEARALLWRIFLGLVYTDGRTISPLMSADKYTALLRKPKSEMNDKILNDSFRTLTTNKEFQSRVPESHIIRCLEAYVWYQNDHGRKGYYVQGMNVLVAPFLYAMPSQLEAFATFTAFLTEQIPRYVLPNLDGARDGVVLVDKCLETLDEDLAAHIRRHGLKAEIYAFPSVLTFSAATTPLDQVLRLWDFFFAWGPGLNVLAIVARLSLERSKLLSLSSAELLQRELKAFPTLDTGDIIQLIISFVAAIPPGLYDTLVRHPWDDTVNVRSA